MTAVKQNQTSPVHTHGTEANKRMSAGAERDKVQKKRQRTGVGEGF